MTKQYITIYCIAMITSRQFSIFMAHPQVGIIPLYIGYGADGTTWFSSELKGLQKHCDHIEVRPLRLVNQSYKPIL